MVCSIFSKKGTVSGKSGDQLNSGFHNHMKQMILPLVWLISLTACAAPSTPAPTLTPTPTAPPFDREAETYRIYAAIIGRCVDDQPSYVEPETQPRLGDAFDFINGEL